MGRRLIRLLALVILMLAASTTALTSAGNPYNWWSIDADGNAPRQITRFSVPGHGAFWSASPDGAYLAVSSLNGLSVVDSNGQVLREFSARPKSPATFIRWDSDDVIVFGCQPALDEGRLTLDEDWFTVDWPGGNVKALASGLPGPLYLSPDRKLGAVIRSKIGIGKAFIVDFATGARHDLPFENCTKVLWSPAGDRAVVSSFGGTSIVDAVGNRIVKLSPDSTTVHGWSSDGQYVLLGFSKDSLMLVDATSSKTVHRLRIPQQVEYAVLSPDGNRIAYVQDDGTSAYDDAASLWVTSWTGKPEGIAFNTGGIMALPAWGRDEESLIFAFWPKEAFAQMQFPKAPAVSVVATAPASSPNAPDFRSVRWGMTADEVMAAETETTLSQLKSYPYANTLSGSVTVAGRRAFLYYEFSNSQLSEAYYIFPDTHVNENLYIDDFRSMRDLLTLKYGPPVIDEIIWKRELYRHNPDKWGLAVTCGDLRFRAEWDTPRTRVILSLVGDDFEGLHDLTYKSKVTPTAGPDLKGL